ncbi:FAD-dependent oxidoreductase [Nocardia sp. R6R-6]|uniref:FAD-dependent oxidoreductase n=1 Tax=Nocardia sp. R6R-6 TaxID=3459303 RepID=UPI00403DAADE
MTSNGVRENSGDLLDEGRTLVVVGASLAGLRAVETARKEGFRGKIVLIGDEPHLPYDRPPLSKAFLERQTEDTTLCDIEGLTGQLGVDLRLGTAATQLDIERKELVTSSGTIVYDSVIIATGSTARTIEGVSKLGGVHVLRTRDDAVSIRAAIQPGVRVVVVGGGFIGSEVASVCHKLGAEVTIIESAAVPLVRAVGSDMGAMLTTLHRKNGIRTLTGVAVQEVIGQQNVSAVRLADGSILAADLLIVGIGAVPATAWLEGSGVQLHAWDRGVVCDRYLESSVPDVWAAGDVAHWHNEMFDQSMRLENWTSAGEQGAHAARNALGLGPNVYRTVPYYWSVWYDHRIQFVGVPDADEVRVCSGSVEEGRLLALYRRGSRLVGALTINESRRIMKLRTMIAAPTTWSDAIQFFENLHA